MTDPEYPTLVTDVLDRWVSNLTDSPSRFPNDRSFVAGVVDDGQRRSVVAALAGLAENTGMTVVEEDIDQPDQVKVLRDLGCQLGQGFHYARPMPYDPLEIAHRTEGGLHQVRKPST